MPEPQVQQPPAPSVAQPAAPSAPQATQQTADDQNPPWLKGRLDRERDTVTRQLLAELGVTDAKDAKASIDALKKLQEAQKTEEQRLREQAARVQPLESEVASLKAAVAAQAAETLAALTDAQRAAVRDIAGDDPAAQLRTIVNLRKSGMLAAPASATTQQAPAPVPPPASTTAAPAAPTSGGISPPNHLQTWMEMRKTNPILAAHYRVRYAAEITAAQKTQAT